jgi:thymidylate kinase
VADAWGVAMNNSTQTTIHPVRAKPLRTPADLFSRWFAALESEHIPYVILHSYERFPDQVVSDVDYAVEHNCLPLLPALEQKVAADSGWVVAQRLEHEAGATWTILVNREDPTQYLMLDCTSHYVRNNCFFLRDADLLTERRRFKSFYVPAPAAEFIYTLVKICAKAKPPAPYVPRLRELHAQAPRACDDFFVRLFGLDAGPVEGWLERAAQGWNELSRKLHARRKFGWGRRWAEWQRIGRRIRKPTGFTVAFLGPDGVGKSTVIQAVQELILPCFRRKMLIHFNPRFGPPAAGQAVTNPQGRSPRSALFSWGKALFYFGRNWAHYLVKQLPARRTATLIIYDRNHLDLGVDPWRYRMQGCHGLLRFLARLSPQPDLLVILDASAETIRNRKAELTGHEIERQRGLLQAIAKSHPQAVTISTEQSPEAVSCQVAQAILDRLAVRHQS